MGPALRAPIGTANNQVRQIRWAADFEVPA